MSKYLKISDDIDEFQYGLTGTDKLKSASKIFAKGLANIAIWGITELPKSMIEHALNDAKKIVDSDTATSAQKEKAMTFLEKHQK